MTRCASAAASSPPPDPLVPPPLWRADEGQDDDRGVRGRADAAHAQRALLERTRELNELSARGEAGKDSLVALKHAKERAEHEAALRVLRLARPSSRVVSVDVSGGGGAGVASLLDDGGAEAEVAWWRGGVACARLRRGASSCSSCSSSSWPAATTR